MTLTPEQLAELERLYHTSKAGPPLERVDAFYTVRTMLMELAPELFATAHEAISVRGDREQPGATNSGQTDQEAGQEIRRGEELLRQENTRLREVLREIQDRKHDIDPDSGQRRPWRFIVQEHRRLARAALEAGPAEE